MQRHQLEADGERLRGEYEALVAAQQEQAAEWEAAAKREDAAMASRKQVRKVAGCCSLDRLRCLGASARC